MNNRSLEGVGTFIYCIDTKRYLFLLRNTVRYNSKWGLAGGKVEHNEQLVESLYRELNEELGYDFGQAKVVPIEKFTSENKRFSYHTFLIPVTEEFVPKLNKEHRGFCWVELDDRPKPLHPGVWRTLKFKEVVAKIKSLEEVF
jgi:8-oxo-dGTP pyrophosphatase MutT (NUDIX family)